MIINKRNWIECLFIAAFIFLLAYQVLIQPIVGMPDNGDFPRMMKSVGLTPIVDGPPTGFQSFPRYYKWDFATRDKPFPSSQLLFVTTSLVVNKMLLRANYDITSLGIVYLIFYTLVFVFAAYCGYKTQHKMRWLVYLALLFVFTDVAYVGYFNSLYAEPSALTFFCFSIVFAVLTVWQPTESKSRWPMIGLLCSIILFTIAKLQNVMLAPLFAIMVYVILRIRSPHDSKRSKSGIWAAIIIMGMAVCYWSLYTFFPMGIRDVNVYDSVFFEIIANSPNPKADLKELGLDASYEKYKGTTAWSEGVTPEIYFEVYDRVGEKKIIRFYMRHPDRFLKLQWRAAKHGFDIRPGYLGNFESSHARLFKNKKITLAPGESRLADSTNFNSLPKIYMSQSCAFNSGFKKRFLVGSSWSMLIFFLINIGAVIIKLWKYDFTPERRAVSIIHTLLIIMAVAQFLTVTLGAGELDLVKHLFLFDLICDVCFVFLMGYLAWIIIPTRTKPIIKAVET